MQSLVRSIRTSGDIGEPLPQPWKGLKDKDVVHRRAEMSIIAAGAGAGKSAFALNYVIRSGAETLYFAADTNKKTMGARTLQATFNIRRDEADWMLGQIEDGDRPEGMPGNVEWVWDPHPSIKEIILQAQVYLAVYGEYPELIVIDNLRNVVSTGGGEEKNRHEQAASDLKRVALNTGSHVMVLHHVNAAFGNGDQAVPQNGVEGQVTKEAELVLGLFREGGNDRTVSIIKNRDAEFDPTGKMQVKLSCDLSRMQMNNFAGRW